MIKVILISLLRFVTVVALAGAVFYATLAVTERHRLRYDVVLLDYASRDRSSLMDVLMARTTLNHDHAESILEQPPAAVLTAVSQSRAMDIVQRLEKAGGSVSVRKQSIFGRVEEELEITSVGMAIKRVLRSALVSFGLVGAAGLVTLLTIFVLLVTEHRWPYMGKIGAGLLAVASALPAIFIAYLFTKLLNMTSWASGSAPDRAASWLFAIVAVAVGDGFFRETLEHVRDHLQAIQRADYVLYARACGYAILPQTLRDILARLSALLASKLVPLMSAAILVENVLGNSHVLAGLGYRSVRATEHRQLSYILLVLMMFVVIVAIQNFLLRLSTAILDPRQRV